MPEQAVTGVVSYAPAHTEAWEYRVATIHARHNEPLQQGLTEQGEQGWELVFVNMPVANEYQCIFRRPHA